MTTALPTRLLWLMRRNTLRVFTGRFARLPNRRRNSAIAAPTKWTRRTRRSATGSRNGYPRGRGYCHGQTGDGLPRHYLSSQAEVRLSSGGLQRQRRIFDDQSRRSEWLDRRAADHDGSVICDPARRRRHDPHLLRQRRGQTVAKRSLANPNLVGAGFKPAPTPDSPRSASVDLASELSHDVKSDSTNL